MNIPSARRAVDAGCALAAIVALAPVLAAIAAVIVLVDGRPVLFRQLRLGRDFHPFRICKFRTMRQPAAGESRPALTGAADAWITPLGGWLRRWKLDELPQLWNILCGEMSLFGPRPELPAYVACYESQFRLLLTVRPGMLDPASLRFTHEASLLPSGPERETAYRDEILPRKIALSSGYLAHRSWWSDLGLIPAAIASIARAPRWPPDSGSRHAAPPARTAR